jgi:zinc protease
MTRLDRLLFPLAIMSATGCLTASASKTGAAGPPPDPASADPVLHSEGDVTTASFNGLQIVVKRLPNAELAAATLYIKGGARNWGKHNAGIEQLALAVAVGAGPQGMTKAEYKQRQAQLGSELSIFASLDFTELRAKGLARNWDQILELMLGTFLRPALPDSEIEIKRSQVLTELRDEGEDPDVRANRLANQLLFRGHVFENRAGGTVESVEKLERKDLETYLGKLQQTKRLLLVVAGDVDPSLTIAQAQRLLGVLPRGDYVDGPMPALRFEKANLVTEARELPTNYIVAGFASPTWFEPLYPASVIAADLLSARMMAEIRARRGLSYTPQAKIAWDSYLPIGIIHLITPQPNVAMKIVFEEIHRLQSIPVSPEELEQIKAVFLTGHFRLLETTDGIVAALGGAQVYAGDWRFTNGLLSQMQAVTPGDVQAFARQYLVNLQTVVLGDPSKVDRAIFRP